MTPLALRTTAAVRICRSAVQQAFSLQNCRLHSLSNTPRALGRQPAAAAAAAAGAMRAICATSTGWYLLTVAQAASSNDDRGTATRVSLRMLQIQQLSNFQAPLSAVANVSNDVSTVDESFKMVDY
eukprot:8565-Heterococcus_DN1.PRE.2